MIYNRYLLLLNYLLLLIPINAQKPFMVGDINKLPVPFGSCPSGFTVFNDKLYFSAETREYGQELWCYDGQTVTMVADINKGEKDSYPMRLSVVNNKLYFNSNLKYSTKELFCYDGINKPELVFDNNTRQKTGYPRCVTAYKDGIVFKATNSSKESALFYYKEGEPIKELIQYPVSTGSSIEYNNSERLLVINNAIYTELNFDEIGSQLGVIRDTSSHYKYYDLMEGEGATAPHGFTFYNDKIYFSLRSKIVGRELFYIDGDKASCLVDSNPGPADGNPKCIKVLNDSLWFQARDSLGHDMIYSYKGSNRFWILNEEGDWDNSVSFGKIKGSYHGLFYYEKTGSQPEGFGRNISSDSYCYDDYWRNNSSIYGKCLEFYNRHEGTKEELKDGDRFLQVDVDNGTAIYKDQLFFCANNGESGYEVWSYDQRNGAQLACDIAKGTRGSRIKDVAELNNCIVFVADDGVHGAELWKIEDGGHPELVADLIEGNESSQPRNLAVLNKRLYFEAQYHDDANIWVYDGKQRPYLLNDELESAQFVWATDLRVVNEKLVFSAQEVNGIQMQWEYDGNGQPVKFIDVNSDEMQCYFKSRLEDDVMLQKRFSNEDYFVFDKEAISVNETKVVNAYSKDYGYEPWIYSESELPHLLKDFAPGKASSNFTVLFCDTNKMCFSTHDESKVRFWSYDGINEPVLNDSIAIYNLKSRPVFCNDKVYFMHKMPTGATALCSWEGNGKIQFVKEFKSENWYGDIINVFVALNRLFIVAEDDHNKLRLWQMNNNENLQLVFDKELGFGEIQDANQFCFNENYLFFPALDGKKEQIWLYDGTHSPYKVSGFKEAFVTDSRQMIIHNNRLYYTANDGIHGAEWWCCPLDF